VSTDPSAASTRTIRVDTGDLRNALQAVLPHAKRNTTGDDAVEHRIRFVVDLPADGNTWLRVGATNGVTTAVALVEVVEDDAGKGLNRHDGPYIVDLTPRDARHMLWAFKARRNPAEGMDDETLELRLRVDDVKVTDVSGLFTGSSILMPQQPFATDFPDVHELSARALARAAGESGVPRPFVGDGNLLALFRAASRAYEEPLQIEPLGPERREGHLVTCGGPVRRHCPRRGRRRQRCVAAGQLPDRAAAAVRGPAGAARDGRRLMADTSGVRIDFVDDPYDDALAAGLCWRKVSTKRSVD